MYLVVEELNGDEVEPDGYRFQEVNVVLGELGVDGCELNHLELHQG